jgi:hypothetical protein
MYVQDAFISRFRQGGFSGGPWLSSWVDLGDAVEDCRRITVQRPLGGLISRCICTYGTDRTVRTASPMDGRTLSWPPHVTLPVLDTHLPGPSPGRFICGSSSCFRTATPHHHRDMGLEGQAPFVVVGHRRRSSPPRLSGNLVSRHHPAPMTDCVRTGPAFGASPQSLLSTSCSSATVVSTSPTAPTRPGRFAHPLPLRIIDGGVEGGRGGGACPRHSVHHLLPLPLS